MAESITEEPPPSSFDSTPIPHFHQSHNPTSDQTPIGELMSDLGFPIDADFELTFDGMEDLYLPAEDETFLIPDNQEQFGDSEGSGTGTSPRDSDDQPTPLSSQGSDNCGSDVSEGTNVKVKVEATTTCVTKRKKEDTSEESRSSKYRRSGGEESTVTVTGDEEEEGEEEDEKKKRARLMRNRESAQLSRQRKKHYVEELEEKVRSMHSAITDLNGKMSYFMAENAALRQQLGGSGMCPPPAPMGMYPPMAYQWMPYMVKQQGGGHVPLIPIPRLKPQNPPKAKSKKSETRTKKVASISFLGLLFCLFLFGALAPVVNVSYGGISGAFYGNYRSNYVTDQIYNQHRSRVLDTSRSNSNGMHCGRDSAAESSVPPGNGSEPLVASLFVPRNDKLVKIDGNLIINSILASEKAVVASRKASESNGSKADGVVPKDHSLALPLPDVGMIEDMAKHLIRTKAEKQKALSSGSVDTLKDQIKTKAANGEMQQWFREGVAGPMFSSGMCTEVFQFDVSSTSGVIIPASPATNVSAEHSKNATDTHRLKNRRTLRGLAIPLPGSDFNFTKEHQRNSSSKEIKPASSMVVSVLVDPREGGDGDIDGMIGGPKSLSRVFVVVLVDSTKYVTYSCVLPRPGAPHLVTT
ncbi:hypothetical protein Bca52824_050332 [Brassica carinata]|uniref:BZIP domain-containing protein n=1 Tax=Brassica carinata TaxID=52824 RepID=A0A8X7RMM9_BRACI|nr:hypothetical protein Bca52824_050332 [Brassica carinata]